jgi:CcmD family protein
MKMFSNDVAMMVILIIWIGVFLYLLRLDRKVKKLEKKVKLPVD